MLMFLHVSDVNSIFGHFIFLLCSLNDSFFPQTLFPVGTSQLLVIILLLLLLLRRVLFLFVLRLMVLLTTTDLLFLITRLETVPRNTRRTKRSVSIRNSEAEKSKIDVSSYRQTSVPPILSWCSLSLTINTVLRYTESCVFLLRGQDTVNKDFESLCMRWVGARCVNYPNSLCPSLFYLCFYCASFASSFSTLPGGRSRASQGGKNASNTLVRLRGKKRV